MKKQIQSATLVTVLAFGGLSFAQNQAAAGATAGEQQQQQKKWGGRQGRHGKQMDPQARLDHMSQFLNLTDDQKVKIRPILESEKQQMEALRADSSAQRQDRRAKMMQIHLGTIEQIRPILNSEQQAKLDQRVQKMKEQREKRGMRKQGGEQAAPPSNQ